MAKPRRSARQREARRRREEAAAALPVDDQARGEDHREQDRAEEVEEPSKEIAYDPRQKLLNLGTHFALLTKAVLKRTSDAKNNDRLYEKCMSGAKRKLMNDVFKTYCDLFNFYKNPALTMPSWLANLPLAKPFYIDTIDMRLQSRELQIIKDLREFVKEQGLFCTGCKRIGNTFYCVELRLDVGTA